MALRSKQERARMRRTSTPRSPSAGQPAGSTSVGPVADSDQIAELQRILPGPQHFQLQFLGEVDEAKPAIQRETSIWAANVSAAANAAAAFPWPEGAFRMRIVDDAGRVVFKRLKPKRS